MADLGTKVRDIATSCACMKARHTARVITRLYDEHLRPLGLQASQLTVLVAAAHRGEQGARFGRLADAIGMDKSTLTRNLAPLERDGLLRVEPDPDDARQRIVTLTRDGVRMIERAYPLWQKAQAEVAELLGARGAAELGGQLDRVMKATTGRATRAT